LCIPELYGNGTGFLEPTFIGGGGVLFSLGQGKSCGQEDQKKSHWLPVENHSENGIHFSGLI